MKTKKITLAIILIALTLISITIITQTYLQKPNINQQITKLSTLFSSPTPGTQYLKPTIKPSNAYTIIFVGDSMIDSLGENFDFLRINLKNYYPNTAFGLFNYGYGSTNILSLKERLNSDTTYRNKTNPAILQRDFDIIIIGSFGHNPLSELSLEEGLAKQTEILNNTVQQLVKEKPNALIVFLADLAPSESSYAMGVVDLNQEQRDMWVNERKAYIKNHLNYAIKHNIPLINIYEESLVEGNVNLNYINKDDYIPPSSAGLSFMSQAIADYLFNNTILP